jgi:signal transduction histidine kinase
MRSSLSYRVVILILVLLFALFVAGLLLLRTFVSRLANELYASHLVNESEVLELSLQHAFIDNDVSMIDDIFQFASTQRDTRSIRVITPQNVVMASSLPEEDGVVMDRSAGGCGVCHAPEVIPPPAFIRLPAVEGQDDLIITANRLENSVACYTCHVHDGNTLGVLLTERYTAPVDRWLASLDTWLFGGGALFLVVVSLSTVATFRRHVADPLETLAEGGVLENTGFLEKPIGKLSKRLQQAESNAQSAEFAATFQRRSFDALLSLFEGLDASSSVESIMQKAIQTVQTATGISSVAMRVYEEDHNCFRLVAQEGMSPEMVKELACIPSDSGFQAQALEKKRPVCSQDLVNDPRLGGASPIAAGYVSLACVPLIAADQVLGSMELAVKDPHPWDKGEQRWLALVGHSIGISLYQAKLTEQLKGMVALEERNRLAQEMHDGLAQLLGSLRLWADEARISIDEKEYSRVEAAVTKIESTARDAYASLREEILGLRYTIVPGEDLTPVFAEYLNRFQRQWGIKTRLEISGYSQDGHNRTLSPAAEIQLLRIVQEGLTNVRRHANARYLTLHIDDSADEYQVTIQDDGRGFNPELVSSEHLGLRIMRERAASAGGQVRVDSAEGQGTRIEVWLPKKAILQRVVDPKS